MWLTAHSVCNGSVTISSPDNTASNYRNQLYVKRAVLFIFDMPLVHSIIAKE
jgi:hypothetical protein